MSNLALTHNNLNKQIYVTSDASNSGLGAVILHKEDGKLKPIQYVSRTLLPAEMNDSQIEKEGLAIIFAIKKFYKYVHGREFILQMEHRPLLAIFGSKKGIPTHTANRLQKWATMLLNYSFKMEFLPSKEIAHVDGLSRLIPKNIELLEVTVIASLKSEMDVKYVLFNTVKELPVTLLVFREMVNFSNTINYLATQMNYEMNFAIQKVPGGVIDSRKEIGCDITLGLGGKPTEKKIAGYIYVKGEKFIGAWKHAVRASVRWSEKGFDSVLS